MKVPTPCRNGSLCARPGCHFMHPWDMEADTSSIPVCIKLIISSTIYIYVFYLLTFY
jgi:hypothetical protein